MMVNWKFAWREVRMRPSRAILTLLSIVIGVAAVVAVTIASGTTRQAFNQIYQTVAGKASLVVSGAIGSSFDEKVAPELREIPGVKAVAPLMKRNTIVYIAPKGAKAATTDGKGAPDSKSAKPREKQYRLLALGIDPRYDQAVRDYDITAGKRLRYLPPPSPGKAAPLPKPGPDEADGVLLDEDFAHNAKVELGQEIKLLTRSGRFKTNVVGFYKSRGAANMAEGSPVLMPLLAAQHLFKSPAKIDSAQVVLNPDADENAVQAEIAKHLSTGVSAHAPESRSPIAEETSKSTEQGMRMARAFSLLVAIFIITNTFLINVTQRRKQLGIMRAIGATRRQIAGMVYREALLMGVVGTVIGSGLGVVTAHYLTSAMGTLYQTTLPSIQLTIEPFLIGTFCGLGVSLLAAALPARKASHLSPLEAMRDVRSGELEGSSRGLIVCGACFVVISIFIMGASIRGWLPMLHAVWAAILLLIGLVLMLPIALKPFSAGAAYLFRRLVPVEGKLARLQLLRNHSRTTLTIGVVFIAISTGIGLAISIMDTVQDVRNWYQKAIVADFFVRAESPSMATGQAADLPDTVGPEIKKVSGIESIDALRFRPVTAAGERANLIARDHSSPEAPDFDMRSGNLETLRQQLRDGAVAIGSVLAERAKLQVGDEIELESVNGPQKFPVAATVNDYQNGGLTIHMEREVARKKLGLEGIDAYVIKADHSQLEMVRKELKEITDTSGLLLLSFADIRRSIDVMMSGVVASLWAMVVLGLLVSAVGVTNTLTINVLEQTREIGLLRIVAMTQKQVQQTIFSQAMIIAILALVPGILAGVAVAYLINLSMLPVTGHAVQFTLHPWLLCGGLVIGLLIVSLAAWFPANRASRLDLPTALRTV